MLTKALVGILVVLVCAGSELQLSESPAGQFWGGMIKGLEINPNSPSNCVQSYTSVGTSYTDLIGTFDTFGINTVFNVLNNFNDFVNQFVASYDLCNYSTIAKNYLTSPQTALLNFLINFPPNISKVFSEITDLSTYLLVSDYTNAGICVGKIIRYSTGISL